MIRIGRLVVIIQMTANTGIGSGIIISVMAENTLVGNGHMCSGENVVIIMDRKSSGVQSGIVVWQVAHCAGILMAVWLGLID